MEFPAWLDVDAVGREGGDVVAVDPAFVGQIGVAIVVAVLHPLERFVQRPAYGIQLDRRRRAHLFAQLYELVGAERVVVFAAEEELPCPRPLGPGTDAIPPSVVVRRRAAREPDYADAQLPQRCDRVPAQPVVVRYIGVVAHPDAVQ